MLNVAQICRRALFDVDAINNDGTSHRYWTQAELISWANDAKDWIEKALYTSRQDYNLVFRVSTDGNLRWDGETYAPSSFQLTTARTYTLPPDLMVLRRIRSSAASASRRFEHLDISDPYFRDLENRTDVTNPIYWDVVGERTLVLANPLASGTLDIQIAYVQRSRQLRVYTTGTVTTTQDSATVTGSSTLWVDNELATPAALIAAASGTTPPRIVSQTAADPMVDPSALYPPISAFASDTSLTLLGNWLTAGLTGVGYMVASIPQLPHEYIYLVTEYVAAKAAMKGRQVGAADKLGAVLQKINAIGSPMSERQDAASRIGPPLKDAQPGQSFLDRQPGGMGAPQ